MLSGIGIMIGCYIIFRVVAVAIELDNGGRSTLDIIILAVLGAITVVVVAAIVAILIASDGSDLRALLLQIELVTGSSVD